MKRRNSTSAMMSGQTFVQNNTYLRRIADLYLDSKSSDVNFVFDVDSDHPVKIPAHKAILSLKNAEFGAMFYGVGVGKEIDDIPIRDAGEDAFKEFLQFFYLDQVRLTAKNIARVMSLCKKYKMDECMKTCESIMRKSLPVDEMCFGYRVALLLEQKSLIEFCEQQIKLHSALQIMESNSFLESERNLLQKILTLVSADWSALETVIACTEWAKAECSRNNLKTSPENLRRQLGAVFSQIPFEKLTLTQYSQLIGTHKGFFNAEEIVTINQKILLYHQQWESFGIDLISVKVNERQQTEAYAPPSRISDCFRKVPGTHTFNSDSSLTMFSSNKELLLTKFYIPHIIGSKLEYRVVTADRRVVINDFIRSNQCVELANPIVIEADKIYYIEIFGIENRSIEVPNLKKMVQLGQDVKIKFYSANGFDASSDIISNLIFKRPKN